MEHNARWGAVYSIDSGGEMRCGGNVFLYDNDSKQGDFCKQGKIEKKVKTCVFEGYVIFLKAMSRAQVEAQNLKVLCA